jgi:transcriptional regulator GlxA family with amidase domain
MKFAFAVPPQVHTLDLIGPSHVFYEAKEIGADLDLVHFSITEEPSVTGSNGLHFHQLIPFCEVKLTAGDYLFVPGLPQATLQSTLFKKQTTAFAQWLARQYQAGIHVCSVCTGTFLLGHAGILDEKQCTTHWRYYDLLQKQFPRARVVKNRLFVEDDHLYSSAGVTSGIDLALNILEKLFGPTLALDTMIMTVVYMRRGKEDAQVSVFLQYRNHLEDRIHKVQSWINQHLKSPLNTESMAKLVHVSPRHLTRLFKDATGITIGRYVEELRVEKATQLLKQNHKLDFIAAECGLADAKQLRRLLKKHLNRLPSEVNPSRKSKNRSTTIKP